MKYPLLFGIILAAFLSGSAVFFAVGFPSIGFLEEPFSVVTNLPYIHPLFIIGGIMFGIGLAIFIYLAFRSVNHDTTLVRTLIGAGFVSGILMIVTPYNDAQIFFKWAHTILALLLAVLTILLSYEFNKVEKPKEKVLAWIQRYLPSLLGVGTAGLFITSGINMLMETYFFLLASLWLVMVGVTLKRAKH